MEAALPVSPGTRSPLDEPTSDSFIPEVTRIISETRQTPERTSNDTNLPLLMSTTNQTMNATSSNLSSDEPENGDLPTEEEKNEQQVVQQLTEGLDEEGDQDDEEDDNGERNTDEADDNVEYMPNEPSFMLAEKISHASSNPSPPPSPLTSTSVFGDMPSLAMQQSDANSSDLTEDERDEEEQLTVQPNEDLEAQPESDAAPDTLDTEDAMDLDEAPVTSMNAPPEADLIDMDSIPEQPPAITITLAENHGGPSERPPDSALTVIDDLLVDIEPDSPVSPLTPLETPTVESGTDDNQPQDILHPAIPFEPVTPGPSNNEPTPFTPPAPVDLLTPQETPPLRRSPRRSMNPATVPLQPPQSVNQTPAQATPRSKKPRRPKQPAPDVAEDATGEAGALIAPPLPSLPTTPQGKARGRSRSPLVFNREVGSLSPDTSSLLSQLIPALNDPTPLQLQSLEPNPPQPVDSAPQSERPPVFIPPHAAGGEPATPQRPTTPARPLITASPSKVLLGDFQPAHAPATPARRITMQEAIETGQVSPVKAIQMGYVPNAAGSSSTLGASAAPATPARRVLLTDREAPTTAPGSSRAALKFGSPVRARSKGPEDQKDVAMADARPALASSSRLIAPPSKNSAPGPAASTSRSSRLPFPLTASKPPSLSKPPSKSNESASTLQSPAKSTLKQPTATSRIPRVGAKPYARPTASVKAAAAKVPPASGKVAEKPPNTLRKVDLSKPSSNKMVAANAPAPVAAPSNEPTAKGKGRSIPTMRLVAPPAKTVAAEKPTAALKRKRGPEPLASPVKQRPIRLVSSVGPTTADPVPRVATGKSTATTSRLAKPTAGASSGTAARPVRRREPPSKTAAAAQAAAAASAAASLPSSDDQQDQLDPEDHPVLEHEPKQNGQEMRVIEVPSSPPTVAGDSLGSPMRQDPAEAASVTTSNPEPHQLSSATQQEPVPSLIVPPTIRIDAPHHDTPPIETLPPFIPVEADSGVRRTSRLRKSAQSRNDMPGDPSASNKPSSRSRKPAAQNFRFTFTDAYSEMSATALKNLTATNTVKNQAYLSVKLETAVIRKDGARPESPMVKIKTIAQREDEEKDRRKQERAARAARRSGGSNVSEIPGSSDLEPDSEDESDSGGRGTPAGMPRHQRGAGEEEDYETPHRAFKRMKLTEDGQEEVMEDQKKRVKWDRGLFTVVFLDEVKLGTRPYSKTVPQTKGCLAPTAKGLPLDTLGNLSEDVVPPLGSQNPENVVVKKFVYDTDVEPEPEPVPPPPPKQTRSKGKKAKS